MGPRWMSGSYAPSISDFDHGVRFGEVGNVDRAGSGRAFFRPIHQRGSSAIKSTPEVLSSTGYGGGGSSSKSNRPVHGLRGDEGESDIEVVGCAVSLKE
jgi:hypothetical protein